jgi:hypothetical protein
MDVLKRASLEVSRRNFLVGSRLIVGASVAAAASLKASGASAMGFLSGGYNGGGASGGGTSGSGASGGSSGGGSASAGGCTTGASCSCFLPDTLIETPAGAVAIKDLRIGDLVMTASGEAKPVKWIGRREVTRKLGMAWDHDNAPVRIAKFAIDGKAPVRDLFVSAGHAIFADGMLIPAIMLVNGVTIVENSMPEAASLTYFHIELDTHEAILAEGLAVESFGGVGREGFDNAEEYVQLYGPAGAPMEAFAPMVPYRGGRQRLASHIRSTIAPVYDFRTHLDKVRDRFVHQAALAKAA